MKKQILMLSVIIPMMFFSCIKKDNIKKSESLSIIAGDEVSTTDHLVVYRISVSNYSNALAGSSGNSWRTYLLHDQ